jgi:hypothetical protein
MRFQRTRQQVDVIRGATGAFNRRGTARRARTYALMQPEAPRRSEMKIASDLSPAVLTRAWPLDRMIINHARQRTDGRHGPGLRNSP